MASSGIFRLIGVATFSLILVGCGLTGVRGTVISVDVNRYLIQDVRGKVWTIRVDESTRRDPVQPGDEVRVYVREDGYAEYMQQLQPYRLHSRYKGP